MKTNTKAGHGIAQRLFTAAGMQNVVGNNASISSLKARFIKLGAVASVASLIGLTLSGAANAQNCGIQGQEYQSLVVKAEQQYEWRKALEWQKLVVDECPSFASFYKQGELAVRVKQYAPASRAYQKAFELASGDDEKAQAMGRNAEVYLKLGGDQQRQALADLKTALKLHSEPKPRWLVKSTFELDRKLASQKMSAGEYRSALGGLGAGVLLSENTTTQPSAPVATRGRTRSLTSAHAGTLGGGGNDQADHQSVPAQPKAASIANPSQIASLVPSTLAMTQTQSMDVRLNFKYNSVEMDDLSYDELVALAKALRMQDVHKGRTIWFVGHSDARGSRAYNMKLSLRRAKAAYEQVVAMWPELAGRIKFRGAGENEPLYTKPSFPGASAEMHRMNRRLEVYFAPPENAGPGSTGSA